MDSDADRQDEPSASSLLNTEQDPADLFELVSLIGTGNFGHVWKGVVRATGEAVAIKIVPAVDKDTFFTLMREIQLLASCRSPYVTAMSGAHMIGTDLWICLELCNVGSLADALAAERRGLSEPVLVAVLEQLVKGLAYLHSKLLVHRDVKGWRVCCCAVWL